MMGPMFSSPRAQQNATRAAFFVPGFAVAGWAPIVPFAKASAGLDDASLGLVLLCLGTGALLSMPLTGALTARQGCRRVMIAALLLMCAVFPLLALAGSPWQLGAVLFLFGVANGGMDCAMNVQAVVVERDSGKAMMSGFHAFYSIGGFAGAAVMTVLLALGVIPWVAGVVMVAVMFGVFALSAPHWRGERTAHDGPAFALPRGVVAFIGFLCFLMFLTEGSMLDWSAVFLHEVHGLDTARAGLGYTAFSLAMTAARLLGDSMVRRLGRPRTVVVGGVCACVGLLAATLSPSWQGALAGYVLVGLGCANTVPVMFSLAGQQKIMPASLAVAAISTLGYAGILAGPALIGFLAHATSLVTAFLGVSAAMLGVAIAMRWLRLERA